MPKQKGSRTKVPNRAGVYKLTGARGVRYEAVWRAPDPATGKRRQFSKTFAKLDEAANHLVEVRQQAQAGTFIPASRGRVTFGEVFEGWLAAPRRTGPLKQKTVDGYRWIYNCWLVGWTHRPVGDITREQVMELIANVQRGAPAQVTRRSKRTNRKPQTVHNVYNVISGVLGHAVDTDRLAANPAARVRKKLQSRQQVEDRLFLSAGQVATLAAALPAPWDLFVRLAAWSGLRSGELGGLRPQDVDARRARVSVRQTVALTRQGPRLDTPKSVKSRRTVPIPPALAREVAAHVAAHDLGSDDRLFPDPDGGLLHHEHFYRRYYKPACRALGLDGLRFHDLRHTYASLMHAQGRSMLEVSRWMGHSTYRLTADTYSHLWDGEDEALGAELDAAYSASLPANVVPLRRAG